MTTGPRAPSARDVLEMASDFGIDMEADEAATYARLMGPALHAFRRLEELPEQKPPVKYPRTPGYRPKAADNPYNAWYWRTEIEGATEGPLKGERIGVKDAICVAGVPMMNGSQMLEGYVPDIDATIVTRLLDAGAIIAGKTNAEDCSMSGAGHTCALGPVHNPHKPTHGAGGSSGGSAAALAAGDVDMALGGDQGGSIRVPAAWSGVYGLKPTYGLVPYTGCAMIEMTLDHVGPMANSTEGVARMLSVIAGPDPLDPRQRGVIPKDFVRDYRPALERGIKGVKIGLIKEGFAQPGFADLGFPASEKVVDEKVMAAARRLERLGAEVSEVSIPMHIMGPYIFRGIILEGAADFMIRGNGAGTNWAGFYNTTLAEAFARGRLARANDMAPSVRIVLFMGDYLKRNYHGRYYAKAQNARHLLTEAYDEALERFDLLVMPTVPIRATPLPSPDHSIEEDLMLTATMPGNTCQGDVTGHPSMSVPCGMADGLPIGMMITGRHFEDSQVISAAAAFESVSQWRTV
jgi:amidase